MAYDATQFSLDRRDRKVAGVCSTLGTQFGIDATFVRVGFVAAALIVSFKLVLALYVGTAIYLGVKRRNRAQHTGQSEYDRMDLATRVRPSVHAVRTQLDPIDRRLMAIDDHIAKPNRDLAREIDALAEDK